MRGFAYGVPLAYVMNFMYNSEGAKVISIRIPNTLNFKTPIPYGSMEISLCKIWCTPKNQIRMFDGRSYQCLEIMCRLLKADADSNVEDP